MTSRRVQLYCKHCAQVTWHAVVNMIHTCEQCGTTREIPKQDPPDPKLK